MYQVEDITDMSSIPLLDGEEFLPCTKWEFDTSFWQRTIIMDFDLVCDVGYVVVIHMIIVSVEISP